MAGSIDLVMRGFAGIKISDGIITINPRLPRKWKKLTLRFQYKERWVLLSITKNHLSILIQGLLAKSISTYVEINDKLYYLQSAKTHKIPLKKK